MKTKSASTSVKNGFGGRFGAERSNIATSNALLHRVITIALMAFALWSAFVIIYPVMGNGWMYNLQQPVPVVMALPNASEPRVLLRFNRYSMWTMSAIAHRELHCDSVQQLPPEEIVLEAGRANFIAVQPFLQTALNGDEGVALCYYVGALAYAPFGDYGPKITYEWFSEEFAVDRGLAK